jgi:hypothetical protein
VFGVMIIASVLTVFKAISAKYFTEIYLQNIHTNSLLKMLFVTSHFLVFYFPVYSTGKENCIRYTTRCK